MKRVKAVLDPFNPVGTTRAVNFRTSRTERYAPGNRCHLNWCILDSAWEGEFCRVLDAHQKVLRWVKNHSLGFEVPYEHGGTTHRYVPDFIVVLDGVELLHVVVEVKGQRRDDDAAKARAMHAHWIPGINALGCYGRWAFLELLEPFEMERGLRHGRSAAALDQAFADREERQ